MIIDAHTHVGDLRGADTMDRRPVTWSDLLERLDDEGIDKAVFLPLGCSPESTGFPMLLSPQAGLADQLREARSHRDRIIPFGNLDPRMGGAGNLKPGPGGEAGTDFSWVLERLLELGCAGIGEVSAHIPFDDPLTVQMVRACGRHGLPVLFHGAGPQPGFYGLWDEVGSPRLERLLQQAPEATLIGHGPGFWSEISGDLTVAGKNDYGTGPVKSEGSLPRLLRRYGNLYADISANSGYHALSRDREYGAKFLDEFQDRVVFGTDVCYSGPGDRMPHLGYLTRLRAEAAISAQVFDKIAGGNISRILKLG